LSRTLPAVVGVAVGYNEMPANDETTNDCMKKSELKNQVTAAIQACLDKKAEELSILEMEKGSGAFTDYFVLCSGTNPRQIQAIADEVELRLKGAGMRPNQIEGYKQAEWVLIDYVDFVVHVFSEKARKFYDLERLWKTAKRLEPAELKTAARKRKAESNSGPKRRTRKTA
jgi:ribosome-associated protein